MKIDYSFFFPLKLYPQNHIKKKIYFKVFIYLYLK